MEGKFLLNQWSKIIDKKIKGLFEEGFTEYILFSKTNIYTIFCKKELQNLP